MEGGGQGERWARAAGGEGQERIVTPRAVGCVLGLSLHIPEVSSGGGCILLGLLLSGQGWSSSPEVVPEDQVLLICAVSRLCPLPGSSTGELAPLPWCCLGESHLRVATLRTPVPRSSPDPQLHGHPFQNLYLTPHHMNTPPQIFT